MTMATPIYKLETIIGAYDVQDMQKLSRFFRALSLTNIDRLGVRGNGTIRLWRGDYAIVFDSGAVVGCPDSRYIGLMRRCTCVYEGCYKEAWSFDSKPRICHTHKRELLELDEVKEIEVDAEVSRV